MEMHNEKTGIFIPIPEEFIKHADAIKTEAYEIDQIINARLSAIENSGSISPVIELSLFFRLLEKLIDFSKESPGFNHIFEISLKANGFFISDTESELPKRSESNIKLSRIRGC